MSAGIDYFGMDEVLCVAGGELSPRHRRRLNEQTGLPPGFVVADEWRKAKGLLSAYFAGRMRRINAEEFASSRGAAYPKAALEAHFKDVLPPGGYVRLDEACKLVGLSTSSGVLKNRAARGKLRVMKSPRGAYARTQNWYCVADLLALRDARKAKAKPEPVKAAGHMDALVAAEAPLEYDAENDPCMRARRAQLCRKYGVRMDKEAAWRIG